MTLSPNQLKTEIFYPHSDRQPMAESDAARDYLVYGVEALEIYFQDQKDVYVSGNVFVYYKKGVPSAVVAPDVFVVFGVEKRKRKSFKVWEEGNKVPSFILEITSETTQEVDEEEKPLKYSRLGVQEYFQYDPTADYLNPQLKGQRLVAGQYQPILPQLLPDGVLSIHSEVLGLDLRLIAGELRFYNPRTGKKLLNYKETEQARQQAEQAQLHAIPRLLKLGLSIEQIATALSLSVEEVQQNLRR
ncbi:Uma2 family endonuclease [Scytonema sp. UIC 10036]|uniref:Uma2 family endonuclease n=1 Tax=Scytonema sp. UIC 10036 TaxID=2304196 RepID=UPI0012DA4942|nr:Uma2 family endonuclease [Scytonema sp. UIC 10036]MUG96393.1 Uma2 family endonuclease [Scytonema sp. UIC 10036]